MKKNLLLTLVVCAVNNVFAYDAFIDGIYYNLDSTTYTAMVTNQQSSYYPAESYTDVVNIPSFITHNSQTYQVTTIGMFAFCGCSKLTSVTIPSSITTIGKSAFSSCRVLTSVTIPNSVTTIGDYAFQVCDSLVSVAIGDSVTTIGLGAFEDCRKLSSIEIPNSVTTIGSYAFQNCSGLLFVKLSNSIKTIESSVFEGTSLTSIEIPNSVTTIGDNAFSSCSGLISVTIGNSVTTIGDYAFAYCSSLSSITIPNSVTTIGNYAFYGCSSLNSITIPNSVTTIREEAFYGCKGLTSVRINSDAICCKKYSYNANIKYIFGDQVKEYIVGDSVNTIGEYAFYECKNMESVTIGKSVTSIESFAFSIFNGNLQKTNYTGTIASWCKIKFNNGVTDNPIGTSGNLFINDVEIKDLVIPEGVDTIEDYAFCGCFGLNSITIPSSVTTIGDSAFWCCSNLKSITCYATTPPNCGNSCYFLVSKSIPVYVPAHSVNAYKQAAGWKDFYIILADPNDLVTVSCVVTDGEQTGAGKYVKGDSCTLTVTPNYGYHFTCWSDGNTDNPRTIIVTQDTTFTAEFAKNIYTISTQAEHGSITGGGDYEYLSSVQLTATADEHYHFAQWSDWNTNNPRQITVEEDKTYTAIFSIDQYTISAYAEHGRVIGTGSHDYGTEATLTVIPDFGYEFAAWSDGNTDNPKIVLVTENASYYSTCVLTTNGFCGNNLYWEYNDGSLIITGQGAMYNYSSNEVPWLMYRTDIKKIELSDGITNIGDNAFSGCSALTSITIPNSVTTIGESVFENCTYLKTITLGKSLTDIGCNAFKGDFRIEEITSYAEVTPNVCSSTFDGLSKQYIYLYVPENSIRGYQVDPNWNGFDIRTKSAEKKPIDGDNPIVTPTNQDVTITWPITDGTNTYTLTITKNGEVVCVLTFNANGQLTNIAFAAPGHNGAHQSPAATLTAQGYQFTVTGLTPGTAYDYSVTATDAGGQTLAEHKGNFNTTGGTGLNTLPYEGKDWIGSKYFHNGNLIIERNGIKYTATGQKVR